VNNIINLETEKFDRELDSLIKDVRELKNSMVNDLLNFGLIKSADDCENFCLMHVIDLHHSAFPECYSKTEVLNVVNKVGDYASEVLEKIKK